MAQIQSAQLVQAFRAYASKFIEQLREGPTLALAFLSPTIEWLKSLGLAKLHDYRRSRHPISAVAKNQMADDVERAPSVFPFIPEGPGFRQIAEKRIESGWSASEKRNCVRQAVFHHGLQFAGGNLEEILIVAVVVRMRRARRMRLMRVRGHIGGREKGVC